jgi:hypothetical protein
VATLTLSSEKATEEETTDLGENIQEFGSESNPTSSNTTDPLHQDAVIVDEQEVEKKKAAGGEQRALSTGTLVIVLAVCGTLLVFATIILSLGVLTYRRCSRRSLPPQDASSPGYSLHSLDNTRF